MPRKVERRGAKKKRPTPGVKRLRMRDVTYMKPKGYENYLTLTELSRALPKDESWIRTLERQGRIPSPRRFPLGKVSIRLYSPMQVEEIREILSTLKRGRPKKS